MMFILHLLLITLITLELIAYQMKRSLTAYQIVRLLNRGGLVGLVDSHLEKSVHH